MVKKITIGYLVNGYKEKEVELPEKTIEVVVNLTDNEGKKVMSVKVNCDGSYTTILTNNIPHFPTSTLKVGMGAGVWNEKMCRFDQRSDAILYPIEKGKIIGRNVTQGRKYGRELVITGKPWICKD